MPYKKIYFEEKTLSNGLKVILHKDRRNPLVVISLLYHVGSKNELEGQRGFAHFFEHLMFESTKNINRGEFFRLVMSNGGLTNAYTTPDETFYYDILPSNEIALGLWLESERMMNAKIDKKSIDIQRQVVKEEKKLSIDNLPYTSSILEVVPKHLFKKHPYRIPVIGLEKDLNQSSEMDYINFYKTFYVPNNAVLVVSGDIDLKETEKMIDYYFSAIPQSAYPIPVLAIKEELIYEEIFSICSEKNVVVPSIVFAYRTPARINKDTKVIEIIHKLLSIGESSRLKNVVKKKLAANAVSFFKSMEDYGEFIVHAIKNTGVDLDVLARALDEEIERFKNEGISIRELEKVVNNLEREFILRNSSMFRIAESLSFSHIHYKNAERINTYLQEYKQIKVEDVKIVANKYFNKSQRLHLKILGTK
ncbi:MAG TPA: pitrilysin family protein [Candidatus Angelobacter sp.]|jgi:predicted Zn-dependent peptidase|nr:pitrilysin family protein [Candidatus Angelobacter sp.]